MIHAIRNLFVPPKADKEFFGQLWKEFEDTNKWIDETFDKINDRMREESRQFDEQYKKACVEVISRAGKLREPPPTPPYATVADCGHCFEDVGERA
jgi:hypothetical protein